MSLTISIFPRNLLTAGLMLWTVLTSAAAAEAPKSRTVKGEFVSYEDSELTLRVYFAMGRSELRKEHIPDSAKAVMWNHDEGKLKPVDLAEAIKQLKSLGSAPDDSQVETAETMSWRKAGTSLTVQISEGNATIQIGENKRPFVGNLLSFKDDYLLFRFKDPSPQLRKNYGDSVKLKMNEGIPVYESIDGGEYQRIGTPREAFAKVKEGAIVTVFHDYKTETDEFYLVLVGLKKK